MKHVSRCLYLSHGPATFRGIILCAQVIQMEYLSRIRIAIGLNPANIYVLYTVVLDSRTQ